MNVRFIDTSIMTNLLDVPGKNSDKGKVVEEYNRAKSEGDALILPLATIIETGNHIAHCGANRYEVAKKFQVCLEKTAIGEAPWIFYEKQMQKKTCFIYLKAGENLLQVA